MKILLAYPYFLDERPGSEDVRPLPMGLYWIATVLREAGHDVELLDWHDRKNAADSIEAELRDFQPDVIGFSVLHANRWGAIDIARIAKRLNPRVTIVFGGVGATFLWEHFLAHFPEIDFVVLGEGERTFLQLVTQLGGDRSEPLEQIPGLGLRLDGKPVKTGEPCVIENLNELPLPAKYYSYQHVSFTRGCPWNCTFCGSPSIWGRRVRFRSTDHFVAELQLLYRRGVRSFYFSDDTFTLDKKYVIEICRKVLALKMRISWVAISRVSLVDEEMLYWMRIAGCIQISYGVESGSLEIRRKLNKSIKDEEVKRAFALTTRYGILARAYFIYGCPGETRQTIQETIDLIEEIKPLSIIFYILDLFPGTALYRDFLGRTGKTDAIWLDRVEDIMYFETDPDLNREMVLAFGGRLRESYYRNVHRYARDVELIDKKELYPLHADFLSRLALTFSHGDYARNSQVRERDETAEHLFRRALDYYPDHTAYLGLAIILQKRGEHGQAVDLLRQGVATFPESESLHVSLGISLMTGSSYDEALAHFALFPDSRQALHHAAQCYLELGERANAQAILDRLQLQEAGDVSS